MTWIDQKSSESKQNVNQQSHLSHLKIKSHLSHLAQDDPNNWVIWLKWVSKEDEGEYEEDLCSCGKPRSSRLGTTWEASSDIAPAHSLLTPLTLSPNLALSREDEDEDSYEEEERNYAVTIFAKQNHIISYVFFFFWVFNMINIREVQDGCWSTW